MFFEVDSELSTRDELPNPSAFLKFQGVSRVPWEPTSSNDVIIRYYPYTDDRSIVLEPNMCIHLTCWDYP
jgi:hypothetical protein